MQKSEIVYQHQHSLISFHWKFTQLMFESGLHCAYVKMSLFLSLSIWKSKGKKKKTLHTIFLIDVWNICTLSELICYFISGIFIFIYLFRCIFYHLLLYLFSFFRCGDLTFYFITLSHELQSHIQKKYKNKNVRTYYVLIYNLKFCFNFLLLLLCARTMSTVHELLLY